jgi:hypothetical protein
MDVDADAELLNGHEAYASAPARLALVFAMLVDAWPALVDVRPVLVFVCARLVDARAMFVAKRKEFVHANAAEQSDSHHHRLESVGEPAAC